MLRKGKWAAGESGTYNWLMRDRYRQLARDERGLTMVELLVVMLIMTIIALTAAQLMVNLFDSQLRTGQYLDQQTTLETFYGFTSSRLAVTQKGDVGLTYCRPLNGAAAATVCQAPEDDGNAQTPNDVRPACITDNANCLTVIDPITVSGDQVFFTSEGKCYRMAYVDADDAIYGAVGQTATACAGLRPRRGANEGTTQAPGAALYDPFLDSPTTVGRFPLAANIISARPTTSPAQFSNGTATPDPLRVWEYANSGDGFHTTNAKATTAQRLTSLAFYNSIANRGQIYSLNATTYVRGGGNTGAQIATRYYNQAFPLAQLCDLPDGSVAEPAGGDLSGTYPNPTIAANAINSGKIQDGQVNNADLANNSVGSTKLANAENWHTVGAAGEPAFTTDPDPFSNYGASYNSASFYKDVTGTVHIRGLVTRNAGGTNHPVIFTLPAGYRPGGGINVFRVLGSAAATMRVDVYENGRVLASGSYPGGWLSLNGISFRAEN